MNRKWIIRIEGKEYIIEADYGAYVENAEETKEVIFQRDGKLLVDGNELATWKEELPKELTVEIGGKTALFRKKGLFVKQLELFIEGQQIKPV